MTDDDILSGKLWHDFCDRLKEAGDVVLRDSTPATVFDRAEGYRYLTRLLRAGLESQVESGDPRFPRFYQLANETIKIGNDNPDNIYHNANLDGNLNYRIKGNRGSVHYMSFGTQIGSYGTTGSMAPSGHLDADELILDDNGDFEILISSEPHTGNWLPMQPDTSSLLIRQTFRDRRKEAPANYQIECLNADAAPVIAPEDFAKQLLAAANFSQATSAIFEDWMQSYSGHINELPYDDQEKCQRAGGDASIQYLQSYWKLAPDEALMIHAPLIPPCKTWNFQLSNYWMESLDYRHYTISFNKYTAKPNKDGSVTLVVAHRDPGERYPNWLHTASHDCGGMLWRWVECAESPPVNTQVVKFEELN